MLLARINEAKKSFWFGRLLSENSGLQSFLDRLRFTATCSKFFFCRSSVHREPFKIFLMPFIRSPQAVRNFSYAVQPFTASRSKIFFCHSAIQLHPFKFFLSRSPVHDSHFKRLGHPFVIRSVVVRFAIQTDIR